MKLSFCNFLFLACTIITLNSCSSNLSAEKSSDGESAINSDYNSTVVKYLLLGKDSHAVGLSALSNQCELLYFTFKNSSGRNIVNPNNINVTFEDTTARFSSPFEPVYTNKNLFSTQVNCESDTNGSPSFTIPSGISIFARWMKIPIETTNINNADSDYYFRFTTPNTEIKVGHFSINNNTYGSLKIVDQIGEGFKLLGPTSAVQNQCYKYIVSYFSFDGTKIPLSSRNYRISNASDLDFYSDSNCQNEITSQRNISLETVYVKFKAPPGQTRLSPTVIPDPYSAMYILDFLATFIFPLGIESEVQLLGPTDITNMVCSGPFMLTLVNQYEATLVNTSSNPKTINFTSSTLEVFTDDFCMTSLGTSGSLQIPSGDTGPVIYLRTSSTNPSQLINFSYNLLSGTKSIYVKN